MKLFCYFQFIFILKSFICKSIDTISCPQSYSTCNLGKEGMINVHMVPHTHDDVGYISLFYLLKAFYRDSNREKFFNYLDGVKLLINITMAQIATTNMLLFSIF